MRPSNGNGKTPIILEHRARRLYRRAGNLTINDTLYYAFSSVEKVARSALRPLPVSEVRLAFGQGACGHAMVSLERWHGPPPSPIAQS